MRIVSPNAEASLAAVRHLSESAVNNPTRKNIIVPFAERTAKPAAGYELPPLPEPPKPARHFFFNPTASL